MNQSMTKFYILSTEFLSTSYFVLMSTQIKHLVLFWGFFLHKSSGRFVGGYRGLLSGVTVRPGSVEPHSVVECLYACREGLDFGDLESLGSGMKVL